MTPDLNNTGAPLYKLTAILVHNAFADKGHDFPTMVSILTLSDSNFLRTSLYPSHPHGIRYVVDTTTSLFGHRKLTTVTPVQHDVMTRAVPSGVVDWKRHLFGVGNQMIDWEKLKQRESGFFNRLVKSWRLESYRD
jgi:hypothetical protein